MNYSADHPPQSKSRSAGAKSAGRPVTDQTHAPTNLIKGPWPPVPLKQEILRVTVHLQMLVKQYRNQAGG